MDVKNNKNSSQYNKFQLINLTVTNFSLNFK